MFENYPKIIYKYRNWSNDNHKNILLKNEVYMSPPNDFNDPFDCRITINYFLLNTPEKIETFIEKKINKLRKIIIENGDDINDAKEKLRKRLQDISKFQNQREILEFEEMDKHFGILSLSGRWNSILMWSHYAEYHTGFCLGFNESKMRNSGLFGKGSPITYSNDFPEIDPLVEEHIMVKSFKQTHFKAKDWEYENEYRLMNLYPNQPSKEERVITFPEECIEEINLGVDISEKHKSEIIEEARKRKIKTFQLKKDAFKFTLKRVEI